MSKVIIIGGGPSGLACAIKAAKENEVIILERNSICGKKILVTGNGRCNYFNEEYLSSHYHSTSLNDIGVIINDNSKKELTSFFDEIGLIPKIKNGYYYPYSNQATSVRNILEKEALNKGVKIIINTFVENIKKENDLYKVITNNGVYYSSNVVVATGSFAAPKTGSDGNFFKVLKKMNHEIIKPLPSLVQLVGSGDYLKKWKGIREDVILKLYENSQFIKEEVGEIQLTDYGISGICTMQLSGLISRGLDLNKKEVVEINFFPRVTSKNELIEFLDKRSEKFSKRNIKELFEGLINNKLIDVLLERININADDNWNQVDVKIKNKIAEEITNFKFNVIGTKTFNEAQTTSGGISLNDVDIDTMESKRCKGLYLIGEIVDIDGDCGGYNLSFAFLSGIKAGEDL